MSENENQGVELSTEKILVIIPTYNERINTPLITAGIRQHAPQVDILIADDNSPDGTGVVADELALSDSQIKVLHRTQKAGLGAAYLAGFAWAKEHGYTVVVEMDADGSHRPEDLPRLLAQLPHADVILGSRWTKGGEVVNWPKSREVLSRGGNLYTRLWLGIPLADSTGGFRVYRISALEKMGLNNVQSQGYCFQVDLSWRAVKAGLRIVEVPIVFVEREFGESKMSQDIVKEALKRVTVWGVEKRIAQIRGVFHKR